MTPSTTDMAGPAGPLGPIGTELRLAVLLSFTFGTVMLDRMVQLFLAPDLAHAFHLSGGQLGLLAGVVSVCWAASTALFGFISDRVGRKRVLVPSVIAFSLASFLSGFARDFNELLLVRALLGLCEGPCWSVIMALMADQSSARHRGRNLGVVNCAGSLVGAAVAPIFATQVAAAFGWRWAFFAAGIPGLIAAALIATLVREPTRVAGAPRPGLADWLRVLRVPGLWLCFAGAICFTTFVIAFSIFAPIYLTGVHHLPGTVAGYILGASGLGGFVYSLAGPAISDKIGRRPMLMVAAALCVALPLVLVYAVGAPPSLLAVAALLITAAPAVAALMLIVLPVELAPGGASASAIGFVAIGAEAIGATLGPILAGMSADRFGASAPLLVCSAAAAGIFLISLAVRPPRELADLNRDAEPVKANHSR